MRRNKTQLANQIKREIYEKGISIGRELAHLESRAKELDEQIAECESVFKSLLSEREKISIELDMLNVKTNRLEGK